MRIEVVDITVYIDLRAFNWKIKYVLLYEYVEVHRRLSECKRFSALPCRHLVERG